MRRASYSLMSQRTPSQQEIREHEFLADRNVPGAALRLLLRQSLFPAVYVVYVCSGVSVGTNEAGQSVDRVVERRAKKAEKQ